ncbi:MAG: TIGR02757 family protein [Chitinophagales bacterium]
MSASSESIEALIAETRHDRLHQIQSTGFNGLKEFLDRKVEEYNQPAFIADDPISIPHRFSKMQDIEIAGFFSAVFSWGNRKTIIGKSKELMDRMGHSPYAFIRDHQEKDLKRLVGFRHRTFNDTDLLYFVHFLRHHYLQFDSLEDAFLADPIQGRKFMESALNNFQKQFTSLPDAPARTFKHIASPEKKSTCKRLNMFLRWMVRKDDRRVDFGIWNRINPSLLICPIDLHVARVAKKFGLLTRSNADWTAAIELTENLRSFDPEDPVKYDFALFGLGIVEHF